MDGLRVPKSKPGRCRCVKCQKLFMSPDRVRIRKCSKCKRDQERLGLVGELASTVNGVEVPDADGED